MRDVFGEFHMRLETIDAKGNVERVLGMLSCTLTALEAYEGAVKARPKERIQLRHGARILKDSARE